MADGDVCGTCRKFDLRAGQRERSAKRDAELLILGVDPKTIGLCRKDKTRLTTPASLACGHYAQLRKMKIR